MKAGNFFTVDHAIFNYGLKPKELAVYCAICHHRNQESGVAFPSRKTIAKECGIGKAETVDKALAKLCALGLIQKYRRYTPNGGYSSNVYTISEIEGMDSPQKETLTKQFLTKVITNMEE